MKLRQSEPRNPHFFVTLPPSIGLYQPQRGFGLFRAVAPCSGRKTAQNKRYVITSARGTPADNRRFRHAAQHEKEKLC
jgi:hypothetical protein